ncbi:DUF4391 domain-containing protein [Lapidilactobacillus luobeiensis]|uniref:DUF4391 domain-containing protein n=1 Tax=Lapidilactobacillus luobeiensis TaxID=2950371 RepID=UPI0021C42912|nr:DUF4391 domain-containing protein [Lapidilactobacillus luobeiensis]
MLETRNIIRWWGFPSATIINRNFPKTQLFAHMKNAKDKQFLTDVVQSIYMLANLKTSNTHIPTYESDQELYTEIWFYYVRTKETGKANAIYKLLASLIPYPIVLIVDNLDSFVIITGRFERQADDYLKLITVYSSPEYPNEQAKFEIERTALMSMPKQSLKTVYDGLRDEMTTRLAQNQYGKELGKVTSEKKDLLDSLSSQIDRLKAQIGKEKQINRRVEMQVELQKVKNEFNDLISEKEGSENNEKEY